MTKFRTNAGSAEGRPPSEIRLRNLSTALLAAVLLAGVACGSDGDPAPRQVTGVITEITRGTGGQIQSFAVRRGDQSVEIQVDRQRDYGFDLEHLEVHRRSNWPVMVRLEQRDGTLYAVEILDA